MQGYQRTFIELALRCEALQFGEFTLKSGRVSPYFFNAGAFGSGAALSQLAQCYAGALMASGIHVDALLGPAYKGIPLVAAVAVSLHRDHGLDIPFAYNRKQPKDHGETGQLVGAALRGRVLIVDDVITAGTAVRESMKLVREQGARCVGVAVGLDRQERGRGALSAIQELEREFELQVVNIVGLTELVAYLRADGAADEELLRSMEAYRARYGIAP